MYAEACSSLSKVTSRSVFTLEIRRRKKKQYFSESFGLNLPVTAVACA